MLPVDRAIGTASLPLGAALLIGLLATSGCCDIDEEEYVETSQSELAWSAGTVVVIQNRRGDLEIEERIGDRAVIEARKRVVAPSPDEERELAAAVRVEAERQGDTLRLEVRYPEARLSESRVQVFGHDVRRPRARVDLKLQLPPGATIRHVTRTGDVRCERYTGTLEFSATSGDAFLDDWRGEVRLTTRSGDASVGRVGGGLAMSTASGDLVVEEVAGSLLFEATSGDLEVSRVGGNLEVVTASGDLEVGEVGGGLEVRTISGDVLVSGGRARGGIETSGGDIELGLRDPEGRMQVRSASGDIDVRLLAPYPGRLEANTGSGTMDVQIPIRVEVAERNRLAGRLAAGAQRLVLMTASGDISVRGDEGRDGS